MDQQDQSPMYMDTVMELDQSRQEGEVDLFHQEYQQLLMHKHLGRVLPQNQLSMSNQEKRVLEDFLELQAVEEDPHHQDQQPEVHKDLESTPIRTIVTHVDLLVLTETSRTEEAIRTLKREDTVSIREDSPVNIIISLTINIDMVLIVIPLVEETGE